MCGIFAILGVYKIKESSYYKNLSKRQQHRGPDETGSIYTLINGKCYIFYHERLSIMDPLNGKQPLYGCTDDIVTIVNGEIYNYKELKQQLIQEGHEFKTESDSEVITHLYEKYGNKFITMLDGDFVFVLYDKLKDYYLIARDPYGVAPLYYGFDKNQTMYISSEMKTLDIPELVIIDQFKPSFYYESSSKCFTKYYDPVWQNDIYSSNSLFDFNIIHKLLTKSVKKRLMCDVEYGVLLSGGLDSSLIASIVTKLTNKKIKTFSIGLEDSPDLHNAKIVADYIGSDHYSFNYTIEEGIEAIREVIYHLETYDVTTIRAGTPMYLLSRKIKSLGVKMLLSGEGADEIFAGYLYFHKAPNKQELQKELINKILLLYKYDCLRANKATAAWGLETRVPFLDKDFVNYVMSLDPSCKMCGNGKIEKSILRSAFYDNYLPSNILFRQKEQFSDGVGYGWIDTLKTYVSKKVSDFEFENASKKFHINTPLTKEEYYYRSIFDSIFLNKSCVFTVNSGKTVACSTENAIKWDESFEKLNDASGRIKNIHVSGKE